MKIVIIATKPVLTQFGRLQKDVPVDVPDPLGQFLIDRGDAVAFEVKEPPLTNDIKRKPRSRKDAE